jgi:hypothetical protein
MSKEMKQERLEKMIRDELDENHSDRQTPIQSLLPTATAPGAPVANGRHNSNSTSPRTSPTQANGTKNNQY